LCSVNVILYQIISDNSV